jgi:CheY-like chemotaxis protein
MTEGKPPRVLVADDEDAIRTLVSRMLAARVSIPSKHPTDSMRSRNWMPECSTRSCWTS